MKINTLNGYLKMTELWDVSFFPYSLTATATFTALYRENNQFLPCIVPHGSSYYTYYVFGRAHPSSDNIQKKEQSDMVLTSQVHK